MTHAFPVPSLDLHDVAILLDVDGTILDLAPTPHAVSVPPSLRQALERIWHRTSGALALVSGRPLADLDRIFAPLRLPAIGGHGAEIRIVADERQTQLRIPLLDADVRRRFSKIADAHPGIVVEDKGYSLALHYRLAPEQEQMVRAAASAICAELSQMPIELLAGKLMVEIKQVGFNKGSGVRELMTHRPFAHRCPIFVGDDITDEDVFKLMPEFDGIAISVGGKCPGAECCFERPAEVRHWLEHLARTRQLAVW